MKGKQHFKLEDVDRLSRGKSTAKRIGSRAAGHHLSSFERKEYEYANKHGYMVVNEKSRSNLWNIWQKATEAKGWPCLILLKHLEQGCGEIYQDDKTIFIGELRQAKKQIKSLAKRFV